MNIITCDYFLFSKNVELANFGTTPLNLDFLSVFLVATRAAASANAKSAGTVAHVLVRVHTLLTGKIVAKLVDVAKMEIRYSACLIMEPAYVLLVRNMLL